MKNPISNPDRRRLLRLLHGEAPEPEVAKLRRRLAVEPALAAEFARLERLWNGLEAPPPAAVPPGFARRTAARVLERAASPAPLRWSAVPTPVRAAAAAALLAGILLGVGVGLRIDPRASGGTDSAPSTAAVAWEGFDTAEAGLTTTSLAEQYWQVLEGEELPTLSTLSEEGEPTS